MKIVINPSINQSYDLYNWPIEGEDPQISVEKGDKCYSLVLGDIPHIDIYQLEVSKITNKVEPTNKIKTIIL